MGFCDRESGKFPKFLVATGACLAFYEWGRNYTMPKLQITHTPPFHRIYYRDLETYLAQVYRVNGFNVLKAAGVTHNIYPEYLIQGVIPKQLRQEAARIRVGAKSSLILTLETLCVDGHIPPGHYIIDTYRETPPLDIYKRLLQRHLDPMHPECIHFKERHLGNSHFRKLARVIDLSLVEWLKKQPES